VRIYTHAHLPLPRGLQDWDEPDFVVIDESFWPTLVDTQYTTLRSIRDYLPSKELASALIRALKRGKPVLEVLRNKFGDRLPAMLKNALSDCAGVSRPEIVPGMDGAAVVEQLEDYRPPIAVQTLLRNLHTELLQFPKRRASRVVRYRTGKVVVGNRKSIKRFTKSGGDPSDPSSQIPVLCIDADFDNQIARVFLPGIRSHSLAVERNAVVTQVSSTTNAKLRYLKRRGASEQEKRRVERHLAQTQDIIDRLATDQSLLVVGPQAIVGNAERDLPSKLTCPDAGDFAHFGALRGVDRYKDMDAIVVIGRNQPRVEDLEDIAASLWWDAPGKLSLTGELTEEIRGYRLREGHYGVQTTVHPDPRVQRVLEQIRERETLQAIDRLRLIHNASPKHVYVLSKVPLDITVDKLVTWRELANDGTPMERAFRQYRDQGVMPLSPQLLHERHPELFPSQDAAKQAVRRFKQGGSDKNTKSDKVYLIILNTKCHFLQYRVCGAHGPHKTALVTGNVDANSVKDRLKELHGAKVELIDADRILPKRRRSGKTPRRSATHGYCPSASHRRQGVRIFPKGRSGKRRYNAAAR
jgi:hypothetical protein